MFEADFDEAAYGYRPKRSAVDAVRTVHKAIDEGHTEIVDADLSKYFDTIPHSALITCVARRISDGKMLHLIKMWLTAPVEETDARWASRRERPRKVLLALGAAGPARHRAPPRLYQLRRVRSSPASAAQPCAQWYTHLTEMGSSLRPPA